MPVYKLIYFDAKWRGEVIRLAFTAAGQEFEDRRIAGEEWPSIKPTLPQNQVPCLQVDDLLIPQSGAIMRYVGRAFGLYGTNNDESTIIDVILGTAEDFVKNIATMHFEKDETKKAELTRDMEETKLPQLFSVLEKILKENKSAGEFCVGDKISLADLQIFDMIDQAGSMVKLPTLPPKLGGLIDKVKANPAIKAYLAKRK
ncbi:glutathione S-transferase 1-like [Ostrea edulis]|uniref:glutathione S-transferase 1-like n=1 Tax=Ostrea edulis TaxID=37623 RepID=UPI002095576F|nr:glutathione S-transferase 1-like [Ostrea edulis]